MVIKYVNLITLSTRLENSNLFHTPQPWKTLKEPSRCLQWYLKQGANRYYLFLLTEIYSVTMLGKHAEECWRMIQILQVQKFFNSKFLSLSIIDILKQVFSVVGSVLWLIGCLEHPWPPAIPPQCDRQTFVWAFLNVLWKHSCSQSEQQLELNNLKHFCSDDTTTL